MTTPATVTISELLARLRAGELAGDGPCVVVELDAADTPVAAAQRADFVGVCREHYARMWPIAKWLLDEVAS